MDLTGWLEYFTEGLAVRMREVQDKGERVIRVDVLARKHRFSDRQRAAILSALEAGGLTPQEYAELCPKVSKKTLQRELKALAEKGILVAEGATNRRYYRLGKL
jgi:DNA-binding transcriptional ArsR family regulator